LQRPVREHRKQGIEVGIALRDSFQRRLAGFGSRTGPRLKRGMQAVNIEIEEIHHVHA